MYYYGARYYDPKMSLFISVDPLAEQFQGWSPYNYTMNNPINLIDPTGMAPEDTDPPGGKKGKQDKILNVRYKGEDKSIYANDLGLLSGIYHGAKIINKNLRKQSEKLLSGGFHFFDDDTGAKGDMTLKKRPMEGQKVETINAAGFMQGGSFAKGGEGMKWDFEDAKTTLTFFNNVYSGMDLGSKVPESKVTIDNSRYEYEAYIDDRGRPVTRVMREKRSDTAVYLKDAPRTRYEIYDRDGAAKQRARQNINYKSKWK